MLRTAAKIWKSEVWKLGFNLFTKQFIMIIKRFCQGFYGAHLYIYILFIVFFYYQAYHSLSCGIVKLQKKSLPAAEITLKIHYIRYHLFDCSFNWNVY